MSQMTFDPPVDPNEDLVGYEFDSDEGRLRVVGSTSWSSTYVTCESVDGVFLTVRPAGLLREAKRNG